MLRAITRVSLFALAFSLSVSTVLAAQRQKPVSFKAKLKSGESTSQFTVIVEMSIRKGWHTYLSAGPDSVSPLTEVQLKLPDGAKALGSWNKPLGVPYAKDPGSMVLEGNVTFSREIAVTDDVAGKVEVIVSYQACDDQKCLRPTKFKTSLDLPKRTTTPSPFEPPVRLMAGKKPLNIAARQMYPSPAFYDVDNDGQTELVVGDIFGSLNVYENQNESGKGDPVWAEFQPLKTAEDEKIKVSNW